MLLESPYETNTTVYDPTTHFRFRQMKYVSLSLCTTISAYLRLTRNPDMRVARIQVCTRRFFFNPYAANGNARTRLLGNTYGYRVGIPTGVRFRRRAEPL